MNLKLVVVLVAEEKAEQVMDAARGGGATGATVVTSVRGEGLEAEKSFLGLELTAQREMLLFVVAAPLARRILETIADAGKFDEEPGSGMAFVLGIEDAVGLKTQESAIIQEIEESL